MGSRAAESVGKERAEQEEEHPRGGGNHMQRLIGREMKQISHQRRGCEISDPGRGHDGIRLAGLPLHIDVDNRVVVPDSSLLNLLHENHVAVFIEADSWISARRIDSQESS